MHIGAEMLENNLNDAGAGSSSRNAVMGLRWWESLSYAELFVRSGMGLLSARLLVPRLLAFSIALAFPGATIVALALAFALALTARAAATHASASAGETLLPLPRLLLLPLLLDWLLPVALPVQRHVGYLFK